MRAWRSPAAIPAMAHTQHAISRAVAQLAMHGLLPAAAMASLRSISLRLHFVAWRRAAGATSDLYRFFGHAGWRDRVAAMP